MLKSTGITIQDRYKRSLEILEASEDNFYDRGYNHAMLKTIRHDLAIALLFGETAGCEKLANLNSEAIGGMKSQDNQKLFLYIGSKLANTECIKTFVPNQKEADIWYDFIAPSARENSFIKSKTTQEAALKRQKELKEILLDNHIPLDVYLANFKDEDEIEKIGNIGEDYCGGEWTLVG